MAKKVIVAGLLGGVALMVWMFVVNGIFGFHARLTMKEVTAERVLYGGMGHEAAGMLMLAGLVVFILAPMLGAWMLSRASDRVLSSYPRKVMFFLALGVQFALVSDMMAFGIGGYPFKDVILLGLNHIGAWTVVGLVIAWRITPGGPRCAPIEYQSGG